MGSTPKQSLPKFKVFNLLSWKHEAFKINKHKRKIKFDQSLGVPKWEFSPKTELPKFNFLNSNATHMKFSALADMKKR